MRGLIAAAIFALLSAPAALAQSEGLPPDSHAPQRLSASQRQMLGTVARNAATAAQMGSIAGSQGDTGRLGELAHAMAVTNGGLTQELARLAGPENMPLRERVDEGEVARLRGLSAGDRSGFGRELVGWITRHYPDLITGIDTLGQSDPRYGALAQATLPQLREQLSAAQELAQAAMESGGRESH